MIKFRIYKDGNPVGYEEWDEFISRWVYYREGQKNKSTVMIEHDEKEAVK